MSIREIEAEPYPMPALSAPPGVKPPREKTKIVTDIEALEGFVFVGSRSVLQDYETTHSDWDFMAVDTPANRKTLESLGWAEKGGMANYLCISTTAVYGVPKGFAEYDETCQVTLKSPDYWIPLLQFWKLMRLSPDVFRQKFWKSNPSAVKTQDAVGLELNFWLDNVIPHMKEAWDV